MRIIILFLFFIALNFFGACGHTPEVPPPPLPANELYEKAMKFYKKNNYIDAYEAFQQCRTRYPISEWGIKAELKIAECLYYQKHYETAFLQYQEFSRLHPTYRFIDYVYYQMGMCYYKQMCPPDRDQTFAQEAIKQFESLLTRFPTSPYAPSARKKIEKCKKNITGHILYIGDYYYRTGVYNSALHRFLEALNDYEDYIPAPDLIIFQTGKTYLRLNQPEGAREQFIRLLKEYPDSPLVSLTGTLLEDPKQVEEMDKIKVLNKVNPVRAIKSIPIPFTGKKDKKD